MSSRTSPATPDEHPVPYGRGLWLPPLCDMHVHLRQAPVAPELAQISLAYCQHLLAMPNTTPPLANRDLVQRYRESLALEPEQDAKVHIALMLLEDTTAATIHEAAEGDSPVLAVKFYPRGATTGSQHGVRDLLVPALFGALDEIEHSGLVLCLHGEHLGPDVLEREARFVDKVLAPLVLRHPALKIVVEHVSTKLAAEFVAAQGPRVAATVTPQHLLLTIDDLLGDQGLQPAYYCKPLLKFAADREALRRIAKQHPRFFLGSDSAPHAHENKYGDNGCAGCFTAPVLPSLLAQVWPYGESETPSQWVETLREFCCYRGARFYGLPVVNDPALWLCRMPPSNLTSRVYSQRLAGRLYPVLLPEGGLSWRPCQARVPVEVG